jgi:hypothetical protein
MRLSLNEILLIFPYKKMPNKDYCPLFKATGTRQRAGQTNHGKARRVGKSHCNRNNAAKA